MKSLHIFGAYSLCGESLTFAFQKNNEEVIINKYSRNKNNNLFLNFNEPENFNPPLEENSTIISFGPIWLLSRFIKSLIENNHPFLKYLDGIIACSSSSSITKKYSYNQFDKTLFQNLYAAEESLIKSCKEISIKCIILQPSMIYGEIGTYKDKNIYKIKKLMRSLPIIFFPSISGIRQPIHALQLAEIIKYIINNNYSFLPNVHNGRMLIGGDEELTYEKMLFRIKDSLKQNDKAKNCLLLKIPNRIFLFLMSPLVLISPKIYESFQRINSNLSGFELPYKILKKKKTLFPLKD